MKAQTPPAPPYHLYLLECEDGTLYTGVALDVEQRFIQHALGLGAAYTRAHPPRRVLACRPYASKGDALRAEYALKQVRRGMKLNFFSAKERLADAALPPLGSTRSERRADIAHYAGLPA
jgi:putative endonuclease